MLYEAFPAHCCWGGRVAWGGRSDVYRVSWLRVMPAGENRGEQRAVVDNARGVESRGLLCEAIDRLGWGIRP